LTHGVRQGRVGFEVRLERKLLTVESEDQVVKDSYGLRAGWSVGNSSLLLDGAVELFFHKNSRFLGRAFYLSPSVLRGRVLVPHVLCKNCSVRLLLDPATPQWYPGPPGFTPLTALSAGQRVCATSAPSRAQ
ncbi:hypothetical protein XENOCAPTIV_004007, partial [Xenoophorus captivus]